MRIRVLCNGRPTCLFHPSPSDDQIDVLDWSKDISLKLAVKMSIAKSIALLSICFLKQCLQVFILFQLGPRHTSMSFVLFLFLLCDPWGLASYLNRPGLALEHE